MQIRPDVSINQTNTSQKLLELQQEQHVALRAGYGALFEASSARLRELSIAQVRYLSPCTIPGTHAR